MALVTELEPGGRVNGVVYTPMTRDEAPQQGAVRRVDNGVRVQPRDVPLPQAETRIGGNSRQRHHVHYSFFLPLIREKRVLNLQKFRQKGAGRTDVHKGTKALPRRKYSSKVHVLRHLS